MSEDFDKEAERKRLREKYEAEREDREATERMSDLLLKGATMTNKHCDSCGSPIFRYQGQEFCPSCQEARSGGQSAAGTEADTEADTEAGTQAGGETGMEAGGEGEQAQSAGSQPAEAGGEAATSEEQARVDQQPAPTPTQPPQAAGGAGTTGSAQPASGSVEEAREALVRTLTNLARRAEQTDDPRQAKELLAAAREAAETLSRLRGS